MKANRRSFLKTAGPVGLLPMALPAAMPMEMFAQSPGARAVEEKAGEGFDGASFPKHSIKFAVIGVDHDHILSITAAIQRGGGQLVSVFPTSADKAVLEQFQQRFGGVKVARSEDEILNDSSIQLVCGAPIPDQRAPLGVRVMRHGKDYLSDKPGITTLEHLADVRKTVKETKRIFGILYSERLEVKAAVHAGYLVKAGAVGRVVQTINIAPHQVKAPTRPEWFWDPERYGGILTDIGSHQVDQFLYYTGSTSAKVASSQIANVGYGHKPLFQDFGDLTMQGDKGAGYVRVDWFTPDGLGVWGDGRLFILGTDGYIELRKYADITGRPGGNHLFLVDKKGARYIDCNQVALPFGPQFVADIVNRTHVAQDQEQALLAAELVLKAQKSATRLKFT